MTRRCSRCGIEKDISEFYVRAKGTTKLQAWCRPCKSEWYQGWWAENAKAVLARRRLKRQERNS